MNKKNILEYVSKTLRKDIYEDELVNEIEYALIEIETARNIFNNVSDSSLIDVAIYSEEVAVKRFEHLLKAAKKKGISVSNDYIIDKFLKLAE